MNNKVMIFAKMIKFEHTIFALPFAYIAVVLAEGKLGIGDNLFWITLAMVSGRTAAMSLNRIIDRNIDAANPRTKNRALPRGDLKVTEVWAYALLSFLLFFLSASCLSPLAFKLSPICLFSFVFYSYTKRFTWMSHFILGLTIGQAPLAAWIAIKNSLDTGIVLLSLGVAFWVAGFDIIYACDDFDFDRRFGLFSIPARFGIEQALTISAITHIGAMLLFVTAGLWLNLSTCYWLGLLLSGILMFKQHTVVTTVNLTKINFAFFNLNGLLSMVMLFATMADIGLK